MAHPYKSAGHKNDPKWMGALKRAEGGSARSESTDYERSRRVMASTPPVTVMEDFVGRLSPSKGQDNAFRDAIREREINRMKATGPYPGTPPR